MGPRTIACDKLFPSPGGTLVAVVHYPHLSICDSQTFCIRRRLNLPADTTARAAKVCWARPKSDDSDSDRLLLADEHAVRVWDLKDEKWSACISNGSGGMGRIVHATFGLSEEVMIWNDFGARLTVWRVDSGKGIEIKDPKYSDSRGHGFHKRSDKTCATFALLTRPGPRDVLTLYKADSYEVIRSVDLPTSDAQGLKWSPEGRWIAVWDAAREGYRILIFTGDGHIYRQWTGQGLQGDIASLGVQYIEWSPAGNLLAVADFDGRITLLNTRTFSPLCTMSQLTRLETPQDSGFRIFTEAPNATAAFTVYALERPYDIPLNQVDSQKQGITRTGISHLSFAESGRLLASVTQASPTTLLLWSVPQAFSQDSVSRRWLGAKPSLHTVVVFLAPIAALSWAHVGVSSEGRADALLIRTFLNGHSTVYISSEPDHASTEATNLAPQDQPQAPRVLRTLPLEISQSDEKTKRTQAANFTVSWLRSPTALGVAACDGSKGAIFWPFGRPANDDDDSLFDILAGRTPAVDETETVYRQGAFEDTFRFVTER